MRDASSRVGPSRDNWWRGVDENNAWLRSWHYSYVGLNGLHEVKTLDHLKWQSCSLARGAIILLFLLLNRPVRFQSQVIVAMVWSISSNTSSDDCSMASLSPAWLQRSKFVKILDPREWIDVRRQLDKVRTAISAQMDGKSLLQAISTFLRH